MIQKTANRRYSQLRDALRRRLRARLGIDPQESEDLAHEAFLQVLRFFRGKFPVKEVEYPCAYLFKVARRAQADLVQRISKDCVVYDSALAAAVLEKDPDCTTPSPEDALSLEQQFEQAFRKLPSQQQAVLLLCKYQGMTYEEAARASGISVHMVEKHLIRAYATLALEDWEL